MTSSTDVAAATADPAAYLASKRVHLDPYDVLMGPVGHLHREPASIVGDHPV